MSFVNELRAFREPEPGALIRMQTRPRSCSKGTTLYREGDTEGGLYFITKGVAEIQAPSVTGEVVLMHLAWPGSWVGEGALLTEGPHVRSLVARTDLEFDFVGYREVERLLEDRPELWRQIGRIAVTQQHLAMRAYLDGAIKNPLQRCLATLVRLAGYGLELPEEDLSRSIPVSQREFGDMVALCRNTVAKALGRLAKEDLAHPRYRQIYLPSIERAIEWQDKFED